MNATPAITTGTFSQLMQIQEKLVTVDSDIQKNKEERSQYTTLQSWYFPLLQKLGFQEDFNVAIQQRLWKVLEDLQPLYDAKTYQPVEFLLVAMTLQPLVNQALKANRQLNAGEEQEKLDGACRELARKLDHDVNKGKKKIASLPTTSRANILQQVQNQWTFLGKSERGYLEQVTCTAKSQIAAEEARQQKILLQAAEEKKREEEASALRAEQKRKEAEERLARHEAAASLRKQKTLEPDLPPDPARAEEPTPILVEEPQFAWTVKLTGQVKQADVDSLPKKVEERFHALVEELEHEGPWRRGWKSFGPLSGRNNTFHCHLWDGQPTYVVVWNVVNQKEHRIELTYVGTHKGAPY